MPTKKTTHEAKKQKQNLDEKQELDRELEEEPDSDESQNGLDSLQYNSSAASEYNNHVTHYSSEPSESVANQEKYTFLGKELCIKLAEIYISNCKKFHIAVDPNVVIALKTGWDVLQPSKRFSEGSLLPLMNILDSTDVIKVLNLSNAGMHDARFRGPGNGNSNARVLNHILVHNHSIKELDLSYMGLDDTGMKEICDGIKLNQTIEKINLSSNHFGEQGAKYLADALKLNNMIKDLDVSRNALGYQSISKLLSICVPRHVCISTHGNYVFEEILNSVTHGIAFLGSVVGANLLISDAIRIYRTDYHFWACVLYSFSLMFLFLSSSLFHSFFMLPTTSRILQILDHIGIYLLIAGSYTPFFLIALHNSIPARVLLIFEWLAAILGATFATCSDLNLPSTTRTELIIFVCMGLGCVLVWPTLISELSKECLSLLLLGGLCYLFGIIFFILGEQKPIYHTIWHVFVVIAAAIHWFDVYFFVLQVPLENSSAKAAVSDLVDSMNAAASVTASFVSAARNSF